MTRITESEVEAAALEWLAGLGYAVLHGPDIGPEGPASERVSHDEVLLTGRLREALAPPIKRARFTDNKVLLTGRLREALARLNPHLPAAALEEVLRKVRQAETPSLVEENRRLHRV